MAPRAAGTNKVKAGVILIGMTVWAVAAVGATAAHPRAAFLGVILGGILAMAGLALCFVPRRRIRRHYYQETEEDARA